MASKKKKGLSMEEKIVKVEQWFGTHPCPYTMKELQALIPKATGVLYQSIEECVELLVAENRVQEDKVGVHTLFWKLPLTQWQREHGVTSDGKTGITSSNGQSMNSGASARERQAAAALALLTTCPLQELQGLVDDLRRNLDTIETAIAARQAEMGSAAEIAACTQQLNDLRAERTLLEKEEQELALYDPELPGRLQAATDIALVAANRWTENYLKIERYVCEKLGRPARELRTALHIDEGMDYVDEAELVAMAHGTKTEKDREGDGEALSCANPLRLVRASSLCRDEGSEGEEGKGQSPTSTDESSPAPRPTEEEETEVKEAVATSMKRAREDEQEEASAGHVKATEGEDDGEESEAAKPTARARKAKKPPAKTRKRR